MPIPKPELYPPFNVVRLSHVDLGVKDLLASKAFYVDLLGLQITDETADRIYLRAMEERGHHSVILSKSPSAQVNCLGFKVFSEQDLDKAARYFSTVGLEFKWGAEPHMGRILRVQDPHGIPLVFYFRMDREKTIHQQFELYRGARPLRIDHFNCFSPDVQASADFYNFLGFRTTEYTEDEITKSLWAIWMHRKGNIHDMAFTNGVGPRLHHIAFWVANPIHIIDLLDIMSTTGYLDNIERGPGRHGISNAFFLYIRDPDKHRIEIYSSDYQTVDPDHEPLKWDLKDPQRQTLWGAPAPRSWFEEGSVFKDLPTREPVLRAQPIVAP